MSRLFRPLDVGFWGDLKVRALTHCGPCALLLWIYLLTGPHVSGLPGLYVVGISALAESLRWPVDGLRKAFDELVSLGMALADWDAQVVFLPNALKHQPPNNPKHLKSWAKLFQRVPESSLKDQWLQALTVLAHNLGKPYVDALNQSFDTVSPSGMPHTHPHPQKHIHTQVGNAASQGDGGDAALDEEPIPFAEIIGALNERSGKRYRHSTAATHRHIQARWREGYRRPDFEAVINTKCGQWLGTAMEMYLRPETLFGPKFEGYLNETSTTGTGESSLYPDLDPIEEAPGDS